MIFLPAARAAEAEVAATILACHDGDTCTVEAEVSPLLPGLRYRVAVRLIGADTPELNGKCTSEVALALRARDFMRQFRGARAILSGIKPDKYAGRIDARMRLEDGRDLAALLIAAGLGRPYDGGRRAGWCD